MSYLPCSYCGDFADTGDGEGHWDVPRFVHPRRTSTSKKYEFICGVCAEKYINEEGEFDSNLPEREAHLYRGDDMAARAEDRQ